MEFVSERQQPTYRCECLQMKLGPLRIALSAPSSKITLEITRKLLATRCCIPPGNRSFCAGNSSFPRSRIIAGNISMPSSMVVRRLLVEHLAGIQEHGAGCRGRGFMLDLNVSMCMLGMIFFTTPELWNVPCPSPMRRAIFPGRDRGHPNVG